MYKNKFGHPTPFVYFSCWKQTPAIISNEIGNGKFIDKNGHFTVSLSRYKGHFLYLNQPSPLNALVEWFNVQSHRRNGMFSIFGGISCHSLFECVHFLKCSKWYKYHVVSYWKPK